LFATDVGSEAAQFLTFYAGLLLFVVFEAVFFVVALLSFRAGNRNVVAWIDKPSDTIIVVVSSVRYYARYLVPERSSGALSVILGLELRVSW
jgi:hypothetical protein|tara:strand:- start:79 stop:354 length:276 start_codon:yes stop_codon:yes gene_type:complete